MDFLKTPHGDNCLNRGKRLIGQRIIGVNHRIESSGNFVTEIQLSAGEPIIIERIAAEDVKRAVHEDWETRHEVYKDQVSKIREILDAPNYNRAISTGTIGVLRRIVTHDCIVTPDEILECWNREYNWPDPSTKPFRVVVCDLLADIQHGLALHLTKARP